MDHLSGDRLIEDSRLLSVIAHVSDAWRDEYKPFPIQGKLPVHADFFGKGTVEEM